MDFTLVESVNKSIARKPHGSHTVQNLDSSDDDKLSQAVFWIHQWNAPRSSILAQVAFLRQDSSAASNGLTDKFGESVINTQRPHDKANPTHLEIIANHIHFLQITFIVPSSLQQAICLLAIKSDVTIQIVFMD